MMKIDIHTHIMPKDLPKWKDKFGYCGFIKLDHHKPCCAKMMKDDGHFFREIEDNCWSPERRTSDCDKHGVNVQVLSTIPVLFSYWAKPQDGLAVSEFLNDHIASCVQRFPKRFVGLGTVPMQSPKLAIKELERCVKELGFPGVEIGTHINGKNLDDPEFFDFFAAAEELGACIFLHPWDMMAKDRMPKYWLPWLAGMPAEMSVALGSMIFSGLFEKLPKLRVACAHGGGSFPALIGRFEHGFNVRPDLVAVDNQVNPRDYLKRIYFDSLVHDPAVLKMLMSLVGEDQIALGTDYPFPLGELAPGRLIETSEFSDGVKQKLLADNALAWLGLTKERFL